MKNNYKVAMNPKITEHIKIILHIFKENNFIPMKVKEIVNFIKQFLLLNPDVTIFRDRKNKEKFQEKRNLRSNIQYNLQKHTYGTKKREKFIKINPKLLHIFDCLSSGKSVYAPNINFLIEQNLISKEDAPIIQEIIISYSSKDKSNPTIEAAIKKFKRRQKLRKYIFECEKSVCSLCGIDGFATFTKNEKYFELHHVVPLSEGGEDTKNNVFHYVPTTIQKLISQLKR